MSFSPARSVLLTVADRTLGEVDTDGLAQAASMTVARLASDDLSATLNAEITDDSLIIGTGETTTDAKAAAALGVPLLIATSGNTQAAELAEAAAKEIGAVVLTTADEDLTQAVATARDTEASPVMSPAVFENNLLDKAAATTARIVLPEGSDDRILTAADYLLSRGIVEITILGNAEDIESRAKELDLDLSSAEILDPESDDLLEEFAETFAELRKSKGISLEDALEQVKDLSYFGTMLVKTGRADGMVSGAVNTTAHTIRPAFQIIRTAPGSSVVSSVFFMVLQGRLWAFGDCAVNPNPDAAQLAEIAVASAKTARQFGIDPKVAMLSYSTGSSGSGPDVDRAVEAVAAAKNADAELKVDGPVQFDAAVDAAVAKKKMPDSDVAGEANVFVFPDLEAGNITYKAVQRTAGALAVGPVLQGLNKPINDLSRGASVPDIINTVAITAIQAGSN